ncbi:MAG: hypothetical protein S0880_32130 [Actinomycetota bacterium]|nr:hypothetical protein [Actinomycetota bacterium]
MSDALDPAAALLLWRLVIEDDELPFSELGLPPRKGPNGRRSTTTLRNDLVARGLLRTERRGRVHYAVATDATWAWAAEHCDVELWSSKQAAPVLEALLRRLGAYLERSDELLVDVMRPPPPDDEPVPAAAPGGAAPGPDASPPIDKLIRGAYLTASGGSRDTRVRLADLRRHLDRLPREELDAALRRLQLDDEVALVPLDDPLSITPEDDAAAVVIGDQRRHLVYLRS